MRIGRFFRSAVAILAFTALAAGGASAADTTIGRAGAVHNKVDGVVRGAARPLAVRDPIIQNQQVRTGVDSTAQLLFLDETSLNVGPGSDITLDRFVYDPGSSKNDIALRATKGIFRFVSGSSDPRSYHLKTPVATIGVRGTIYDTIVGPNESVIVLVEGKLVITLPGGRQVTLDRPGKVLRIKKGGTVEGPLTWDGTLIRVTGVVPYPLYGDSFLPYPEKLRAQDGRTDIVNDLRARDIPADIRPPTNPCDDRLCCGGAGQRHNGC
ncbi:FecR family protein [Kaistia terrae]|uniref:FecR domain-containing protein n=1 Tax=Kaistia terrae TaxID=537017 RepID=A0ABW0PXM4_9HYPH|nr:FecR domain-containing protein [Kaistia terrae]MCX5576764.1 FecR domain-containing protein [Kaistia terrae]